MEGVVEFVYLSASGRSDRESKGSGCIWGCLGVCGCLLGGFLVLLSDGFWWFFFGLFFFDSFVGVGFMSFVMFVQFIKSLFLFYLVFFGANKFSLLRNAQKNVYINL